MGQYDNYVTSQITDRISFLSEVVLKTHDGEFEIDVERIILKYQIDNYFNIAARRHHTTVGFWNTDYHHGAVIQPTIARPDIFAFSGILPIHTLGIYLSGDFIGKKNFGYDIMIGNGANSNSMGDNNMAKSVTFGAHISPIQSLKLGLSCHFDNVDEGTSNGKGLATEDIDQHYYIGSLDYVIDKFRLLTELVMVNNSTKLLDTGNTLGIYVYSGYTIGKVTPYFRWDKVSYDDNEPFFNQNGVNSIMWGVKYEFSYLN